MSGEREPIPSPDGPALRAVLDRPIPALDGVRGLAILAVLAHQLLFEFPAAAQLYANHRVRLLLAPLAVGWVGVQLFFVLSGFLITGILLDTREAENYWSSFFARRTLRIFPPYYLLLLATFIVVPAIVGRPPEVAAQHRHQVWYWLYLSNWRFMTGAGAVTVLGSCWSLAVEEQFYLIWPFVVAAMSARRLAQACVVIAAGTLLLRSILLVAGIDAEIVYECTLTRADALALGALAAILVRRPDWLTRVLPRLGRATRIVVGALIVTGLGSGLYARHDPITETIGDTILALAFALFIVHATLETARRRGRLVWWLDRPLLRRFGRHSYAIYLLQLPLHLYLSGAFFAPRLAQARPATILLYQGIYLVAGPLGLLGLGVAFHAAVEAPLLRLKRFFAPRRPTRTA